MKRLALALLALVALPALAQDTATNAPAATLARAKADLLGETFERWRFAVLTDLDALEASYGELRNFFGQLGVSWPPGSSMERSGDHGFVVRNTRENLNAIRMILDILPVTVLWGELVVLEDAPATNAPAATSARAETFERWRFTILPGLDGRVDSTDTWKSFFGQLGVSWPRGSFAEPSGDDGLVVRNTRENLDTIRMIFGGLSVNVLQGEPVVLEDAPATNAPAATLEQLFAEPWRKRLSPDADPVAEMRKIGTLDVFADTRVLFLGAGVCLTRLKNDPERIARERARCEEVRAMFRCARPAVGVDFERGGRGRLVAFDKLPRETDEEFPEPVRAVPFDFHGFAPANAADDFVVRLPGGDDRWVLVPGLGAFAMPRRAAPHFLDTPSPAADEPRAESAEPAESESHAETAETAEP